MRRVNFPDLDCLGNFSINEIVNCVDGDIEIPCATSSWFSRIGWELLVLVARVPYLNSVDILFSLSNIVLFLWVALLLPLLIKQNNPFQSKEPQRDEPLLK